LGVRPLFSPRLHKAAARARIIELSQKFHLEVSPDARVGSLTVGERQRVEILKALFRDIRILILDEPTAVLTPQEAEALFATLRQAIANGLSIIFISHKLHEVMAIADRVVVLRRGKLNGTARIEDTNTRALAA
ncbi:ATP-binding cassette domain-containing protein, partial [Falsihalocynthiibacter sp. CO-5D18]|uniref:ATP-binding cassette domain-containing protein n=1 Tax=Falsihalocynthiibacter sp. CO-5D18 TaxID=3240872 RepID=UPI0035109951